MLRRHFLPFARPIMGLWVALTLFVLSLFSFSVMPVDAATLLSVSGTLGGYGPLSGTNQQAAAFTTSPSTAYVLNSVSMGLFVIGNDPAATCTLTMSLYSDNSGAPGTLLRAIETKVVSGPSGTVTFTLTSPFLMEKATTYWVVAAHTADPCSSKIGWTLDSSPTASSAVGFVRFGDAFSTDSGATWLPSSGFVLRYSLDGSAAPTTTLSSVVRTHGTPTYGSVVGYQINFNADVNGLTASNFALIQPGLSGASITNVQKVLVMPGMSIWMVSINTGTGDGTLRVDMVNDTGANYQITNLPYTGLTYTIDKTLPSINLTGYPALLSSSMSATFVYNGSDAGGILYYECRLDSSGYFTAPCPSPNTYSGLSDGSHTFEVRSVDTAGNESNIASYTWVIDTTAPPAPTVTTPANGSSTNDNTPTVTGSAEANSTVMVYFDNVSVGTTPADSSGSFTFTPSSPLSDGSHTLKARATDSALNTSPDSAVNTFVVDTIAPDTTITTPPANPSASANATFIFGGSDGGSGVAGFECQLDGGGFSACTSPNPFNGLSDGSHTFDVRAVDNAGNIDASPATYTWVIDTTAPDTTISMFPANPSASVSATFTFGGSDGGSGLAGFECQLDGGGFSACTTSSTQTYNGLSDGSHTFNVRSLDNAGNVDPTPASYTWVIDTTSPPAPTITTPANGSVTNNTLPPVTGTAEANSIVTVYLDSVSVGTAPADSSGSFTFTPLSPFSEGAHTVRARSSDAASNTSVDSNTNTFTVDTIAPTVAINQGAGQADPTSSGSIAYDVTFSEPVTGFDGTDIDLSASTAVGPLSATVTDSGDHQHYTVTVSGMSGDGMVIARIPAGSAQDAASNFNSASTSTDNSVTYVAPGIVVTPTSGLITTEAGGQATFTIVLHAPPTSDVTIGLSSSDTTEGSVSPSSVIFTSANYSTPQTVTVTGVDDAVVDGNIGYTIVTAAALSSDGNYNGIDPADVSVTNQDDDAAGIIVSPLSFNTQEGYSGTYQIRLGSIPSAAPITVQVQFDATQLQVNGNNTPFFLTFSDTTPQTLSFVVLSNTTLSTDRTVTIDHAVSGSTAPEYSIGMTQSLAVNISEVLLPPPPPSPTCDTENFDELAVVRTGVPDAIAYAINCRVLYYNGASTTWLGGDLYSEANLGVAGLLDLGVQQAVDIFSPSGMTYFDGGAVFCLKGEGTLIWLAASGVPRHAEIIGSYSVPDFSGYTCATLFEPGTLILVSRNPLS